MGITDPQEIDVRAIAEYAGAAVQVRHLDGCEARIVGFNNRAIISVSDGSSERRRRFSIAHELGHWRLHTGRSFDCRSSDIGNAANDPLSPERQADDYAADLLLPWYIFNDVTKGEKHVDFSLVEKVSDVFNTSKTATAIRIVEANIEPVFLLCYGPDGRKWFRRSKDIPDRWFPVSAIDSETYAYDVLRGERHGSHMSTVGADAWFDRPGADNFEVREQSLRLSDSEILVILRLTDEEMLLESSSRWHRK